MTSSTPAGRGPYRKGIERRAQIVAAASDVFAELGYTGGSIRIIAERVGVSSSSLLQHFGSKEALLEAVLQDWSRRTYSGQHWSRNTGLGVIWSLTELMTFHQEHRGLLELFLTMTAEATRRDHPAHEFIKRRYERDKRLFFDALVEARSLGEIGPLSDDQCEREVSLLFAVLDGLELQWLLDDSLDLVGLCQSYLTGSVARWGAGDLAVAEESSRRPVDHSDDHLT